MPYLDSKLDELKSWLRYTPADGERLAAVLPVVEPHIPAIIDLFYAEILEHPDSRAVLEGPEQIVRLKKTLTVWLRELLQGPHDRDYSDRRRAIGRRHVEVGLPDQYMFTAMHLVKSEVSDLLCEALDDPWPTLQSLEKVCTLDLTLMMGTYVSSREEMQIRTLQSLLAEHLRLSVLLIDEDGLIRSATRATTELMTGHKIIGRPWPEALPEGLVEAASLKRHVQRSLERRREVNLPRVDVVGEHRVRSFRIHLVPLRHSLASLLMQIEELTDAVEMESRLRRSEALAQLGALSAAVAHELRNPLAGISGAIQVITRTMDEGTSHHSILTKVDREIRRLNTLVTDLLAFARPGSATLSVVDIGHVAREVVELIEADHPQVEIDVNGSGTAQADPNLVRQILHNLVRNAVDAVENDGKVKVLVADGVLRVSDSGPGIPPTKRAEIFEPFVTTKTRGTGLGLAISSRSAHAMSGDLRLAEGPLCGACFELSLRS